MLPENLNLDNILEKKVRVKKTLVGSIEAKSDSFILVTSPSGIKYNVPRSHIESKIGNELMLDISFKDLQRYRDKFHDFLFSILTYRKQTTLAMTVVSLISIGMISLILLSTIHQSFAQTVEGQNATSAQAPVQTAGPPGKPLTILEGASVQGSPNFDPDTITVKKGDKITVTNKDTVPHTLTSGTGPTDPNNAKQFDTSIIEAGATADIQTTNLNPGQYPFFCTVHPYMTGKLVVQ